MSKIEEVGNIPKHSLRQDKYAGGVAWFVTFLFVAIVWFVFGHYTLTEEQDAVVYTFGVPKV